MTDRTVTDPADPVWKRLNDQIAWFSRSSRQAQRAYKSVKTVQVVVGAVVTVLAALSAPAPVTASVSALVVIAEGVQQVFQWHTNWLTYRSTAEALKHEKFLYLAESDPYAGTDRRQLLARRIENLLAQENVQWRSDTDSDKSTAGA
ncbi:DUF4231 domain-containing protein [Nocardia stercoris]|uniref:DUF4231 domain-containing protein n=1 Tax=Nocardia stercoris TaxID=2483361 RepID=UPI00131A44B0|nr:DUF4231 domain-containing protein [Nocardia stercoris]